MLEFDLQRMARHLVDVLNLNREIIADDDNVFAFKKVGYGEPSVILEYPYLSVQPINKVRQLQALRKYQVEFEIHLLLYHGQVADTMEIQEECQKRAEILERYIMSDRKWNYIDATDVTKDRVIHGLVATLDHPFVMVKPEELWSASRLVLQAISQEVFTSVQ